MQKQICTTCFSCLRFQSLVQRYFYKGFLQGKCRFKQNFLLLGFSQCCTGTRSTIFLILEMSTIPVFYLVTENDSLYLKNVIIDKAKLQKIFSELFVSVSSIKVMFIYFRYPEFSYPFTLRFLKSFLFSAISWLVSLQDQACNQKFFRAREFSSNQDTSINIHLQHEKGRSRRVKINGFFAQKLLKISF